MRVKTISIKGKTFDCQGYEPYALKLAVEKYGTRNVVSQYDSKFVPVELPTGTYHPDFYIKNKKTYVEIKSDYTLLAKNSFRKNVQKAEACADQNILIKWVVVYPKTGQTIFLPDDWFTRSKRYILNYLNRKKLSAPSKFAAFHS